MIVPEGKTVYAHGRKFKAGSELPKGVKIKDAGEEKAKRGRPAKAEAEAQGEA